MKCGAFSLGVLCVIYWYTIEEEHIIILRTREMNRVWIVLLRGVGRAGSSIVCYGRRGSPICRLLMCQYSSLSHKLTYERTTQQQRTKVTSSVTLTHMLLVMIASRMFRRWAVRIGMWFPRTSGILICVFDGCEMRWHGIKTISSKSVQWKQKRFLTSKLASIIQTNSVWNLKCSF